MTAKHRRLRYTADEIAAVTGSFLLMAIQISADGGVLDVELCDALTDTSSDELTFHLPDGVSLFFDYSELGGVQFETGLTVDISGNCSSLNVWVN